ncbi:MAG: prepilin peptidase [Alphaproteobacteria bacterium]|nr:prepilin peptidase [Alphaproteobacteria bacterium]
MLSPPLDWVLPLIAAPFIGSFLSVLVVRLPKGEDIVVAPSHCRHCERQLTPLELVPLFSWVAQGGKCRGCGAAVDRLYPAIELAALVVAVWASFVVRGDVLLITVVLGWALLALAAMDLRDLILADALTLPLIPAGLTVAWWTDATLLPWHILGAAAGFALMVAAGWSYKALRGREGLGFGDAKLMAASGAWVGIEGIGSVLLYGAVLGLIVVLLLRLTGRNVDAATPIPLGAGIAAGLWLVWLYGPVVVGA